MLSFVSKAAPLPSGSVGSWRRAVGVVSVACWLGAATGVLAAPVTGLDEQSEAALPGKTATPSGTPAGTGAGRNAGGSDRQAPAVQSTGDKTLDLLLQQPGQRPAGAGDGNAAAGEAAQRAAEARAARERLRLLGRAPADAAGGAPGTAGESNNRPERAPERGWIPPPGGGAGAGALVSGGGVTGSGSEAEQDPRASLYAGDGDDIGGGFWRLLPPDVRAFVRDNRHLLAAAAVLVALGAGMLKLVFRRR